jgi:hypothetical protein
MSAVVIVRPVWRSFREPHLARAAKHVRAGGHAAVFRRDGRTELLLGVGKDGRITELGLWTLLAIEQQRWRRVKSGPARGLATALASRDFDEVVRGFCERDSIHPGPTRELRLDCVACAACCHDSNVVLIEEDLARFRRAGRAELITRPYVRRKRDGKLVLRFADDRRCQHLSRDSRCAIYEIRPFNCRVFPAGSEACLAAREQTLGLVDGVPTEPVAR